MFPGQGAQSVGMGRDVAEASPTARRVFARADDVLGFPLSKVCFEGPAETLERTDVQQPAIFVTSVAIWQAVAEVSPSVKEFVACAGLSLGEYTALHVAGALSFDDALRLVHRRGQLMQQAATAIPSGMVSLIGADERIAAELCEKARGSDVLAPANFNCPGQVVISGHKAACERAVAQAEAVGCRAVALAVAGAFHSPIMEPAAKALREELEKTAFQSPRVRVLANVNAAEHGAPADIRESLARQLTQPVLWQRCVERLIADGVDEFVEVGPGRVLTGLMRKISRAAKAVNISTVESLSAASSV